jgi:hypothetical protein
MGMISSRADSDMQSRAVQPFRRTLRSQTEVCLSSPAPARKSHGAAAACCHAAAMLLLRPSGAGNRTASAAAARRRTASHGGPRRRVGVQSLPARGPRAGFFVRLAEGQLGCNCLVRELAAAAALLHISHCIQFQSHSEAQARHLDVAGGTETQRTGDRPFSAQDALESGLGLVLLAGKRSMYSPSTRSRSPQPQ